MLSFIHFQTDSQMKVALYNIYLPFVILSSMKRKLIPINTNYTGSVSILLEHDNKTPFNMNSGLLSDMLCGFLFDNSCFI